MVKQLIFCLLLVNSLLLSNLVHAASLTLELNNTHVEMGKYLKAKFTYEGNSKPELIDLDLWLEHFYIEQNDADLSKLESGSIVSITTAKLYPRHTGKITLDAIALGGSFVKPRAIEISPSIRNNINALPKIQYLNTSYWADEAIFINIDVPLHYSRNEVIAKEWLMNGFTITELTPVKTKQKVTLKWMIYTPYKGNYSLELPPIVQRGKGRFRFHLPTLKFTIKPLPAYLPSSVASGSIQISSQIINNGEQKIAQITLQKTAYLPTEIEGFQAFTDDLSHDELALNIQAQESKRKGITSRVINITLPKWIWNNHLMLQLSYFNTQTGRLETVQHSLPNINTIPKEAQYAFITFCFVIFLMISNLLKPVFYKWRELKKRHHHIKNAKNTHVMRLIILNNGEFKTLNDWAKQQSTAQAFEFRDLLNNACYQAEPGHDLNTLKASFLKI